VGINLFDGSDSPLTYEQALVLIAERIAWPSEEYQREIVSAIRKATNLVLPEPDRPTFQDPKDELIDGQNRELAAAQAELAELRKAKRQREQAEKLAAAQAELAELKGEAPNS